MTDAEETKPEEQEKDNTDELARVLEDMDTLKHCKTDILYKVKFLTKDDQFVFDSLPLTNSQKEHLLLSLYPDVDGVKC